MLHELHISGLGVVDACELDLHPGLNVLTGETGAGKTMVTVGLALALGSRASSTLVRTGAKAARVIVAVPVAPPETVERLRAEADEVVCLQAPAHFLGVGAWYERFPQLTDEDVLALLAS